MTAMGVAPTGEAQALYGAFLRTLAWLRTLKKLSEPADYQAAAASARALLEIAIDLSLLLSEHDSLAKLAAWEESAKLKAAESIVRLVEKQGSPQGVDYSPQTSFAAAQAPRIRNLRAQYWPQKDGKTKHPPRWTGRSLADDAVEATRRFPEGAFDAYYQTRYQELCWNTHGSGLAGVLGLSPEIFPSLFALSVGDSSRFALLIAELVLKHLGAWDDAVARDFSTHREIRVVAKAQIVLTTVPEPK